MQIQPGLMTYDLEWDYDEPLSVHVLYTDESTILFGGGAPETVESVMNIVWTHSVDTVVIEHADADHYGGIPLLREEYPSIEVAAPADDRSALDDAAVEVDTLLRPGDSYRGIQIIGAPGHTEGNAAYRYRDVLVAGDTVVGADSEFAALDSWTGPLAVIKANYSNDDTQARRSVSNLLDHVFDIVLVTHGQNALQNGRQHVQTLVEDLEL